MKAHKSRSVFCRASVMLALLPLMSAAAETATSGAKIQPEDPATHVLFTGTDIRVYRDGVLHRVRGVEGDAFIVKVKDKEVGVPMGKNPEKLKLAQVQLLSERSAAVTKFKYDRVYTPANDPVRKWTPTMAAVGELNDSASMAEKQLAETPQTMRVRDGSGPTATFRDVVNPMYAPAQANAQKNTARVSGNMGSTDFYAGELASELAKELYDALEVQFQVSSAKPIHSPYVVIMAKYHEKDDPKHSQNWLFAKAVDPIDTTPRKIYAKEAGFPPGFVVEKLQVHLYENGVEVPTDLSENRALLTRDEAHEYLVIDYLTAHKTDTTKPQIALAKLPADWATRPRDESFRKTYYIKVDTTGHAVELFEDEACKTKVGDAYYERVLKDMLFLPALEHGKPVNGLTQVKLSELPG